MGPTALHQHGGCREPAQGRDLTLGLANGYKEILDSNRPDPWRRQFDVMRVPEHIIYTLSRRRFLPSVGGWEGGLRWTDPGLAVRPR
jgi:hypothetical protein